MLFERKPGYFRETSSEQVMQKVDEPGHVIGFHLLRPSRVRRSLEVELAGGDRRVWLSQISSAVGWPR